MYNVGGILNLKKDYVYKKLIILKSDRRKNNIWYMKWDKRKTKQDYGQSFLFERCYVLKYIDVEIFSSENQS